MREDLLRDWLSLVRATGFGPAQLAPLLKHDQDATRLLRGDRAPAGLLRAVAKVPEQELQQDLAWCLQPQNHFIPLTSPQYPPQLRDISDPPLGLFVQGDPAVLRLPQIAIVGSRNPTRSGADNAMQFGGFLAGYGLVITSGLALGIDAAAHRGALQVNGLSVAVLGCGLDQIYPSSHRELAEAISREGALASEFPPDTPPRPGLFPRRNRVISGLSLGVLVVEAALRSGSLITARQALEQGREVFAIPGSIHNPLAKGCHQLIRQGAKLVETGADVLEELAPQLQVHPTAAASAAEPPEPVLDADYRKLLDALGFDPTSTDTLIARTGLSAAEVASMLLVLELEGHVSSQAGGRFQRQLKPPPEARDDLE